MYCCKVFQRQNPKILSSTLKTIVSSQKWSHHQSSLNDTIPKQTTRSKVTGVADHFSGNAAVKLPKSASKTESNLEFEDFQKAFMGKSTREILRALMVYKLCSFDFLVERNKVLIKISRTLLGKRGFDFLMKNSFYGHFVAGETQEEIKSYLSLMKAYGVGAILDYAVEADIPQSTITDSSTTDKIHEEEDEINLENLEDKFKVHMDFADRRENVISARTYFYEGEEKCDENMEVFLKCIDTTSNTSENGFAAIKVTALGRPVLLLRLSQILNQTQVYFDLLAENKGNCITERSFAEDAFEHGLKDLGVDMTSAEVKQVFDIIDTANDGKIDIHEWHSFLTPRLKLARLFRAKPITKGEKGGEVLATLTDAELKEMENMTDRLLTVAQRAKDKNVRLMVDAEQTYFQPAISRITLEAMRFFNRDKPIIFNTYQCYLKDTPAHLRIDMELARREGFKFACKLVRGAYMEQERARAEAHGYADPIHDNKENTHACYNDMLFMMLEEVRDRGANVMAASHNEASVRHAIKTMQEFGIKRTDDNVFFGQLLGMCDAITYALGGAGYSAYKYVPYGPVEDVIPYLSRRAMENKSVMLGVMKERQMLWNELARRARSRELGHNPWAHVTA